MTCLVLRENLAMPRSKHRKQGRQKCLHVGRHTCYKWFDHTMQHGGRSKEDNSKIAALTCVVKWYHTSQTKWSMTGCWYCNISLFSRTHLPEYRCGDESFTQGKSTALQHNLVCSRLDILILERTCLIRQLRSLETIRIDADTVIDGIAAMFADTPRTSMANALALSS